MPIVFVHGVNNRREDVDYDEREARTRGFLKEILAPRLGLDPSKVSIFFPYWGGDGVKFRWGQASWPRKSWSPPWPSSIRPVKNPNMGNC